jgi:hypothetical protein
LRFYEKIESIADATGGDEQENQSSSEDRFMSAYLKTKIEIRERTSRLISFK